MDVARLGAPGMEKRKDIVGEPAYQSPQTTRFMIQDPVVVDIPRSTILGQIIAKIGGAIRMEGVANLDGGRRVAWLTVELPCGARGLPEVEAFQSIPCMTDFEAWENVSELVINHYIVRMNIIINDINYAPAIETYRQLSHCMCWSQILQTRYETLRMQKNMIANSHVDLLQRLSSICGRYSDIIPPAPGGTAVQIAGTCIQPIMYAGVPPGTRHEQLAMELFDILQGNELQHVGLALFE